MSEILEELRQATNAMADAEASMEFFRTKMAEQQTKLAEAKRRRLQLVLAASAAGERQPEIAEAAGITQGRVSQILSAS